MIFKLKNLLGICLLATVLCFFTFCSTLNSKVSSQNIKQPTEDVTIKKPNILFIAVDDLKPLINAYGDKNAITPALDRLAKEGIVFENTYCQQAICAASRASILTGLRPDRTKVWDLVTNYRQVNPNVTSLPQYFKSMGYNTAAMGKIFHVESAGPGHDGPSWNIPYRDAKAPVYALPFAPNEKGRGKSFESADVADDFYVDGKITGMAVSLLDSLSNNAKPFFLAVGFRKPHLPFVAPKKYWDLFKREQFKIAPFQEKAKNSPDIAYHSSGELKNYSDIPAFDSYSDEETNHLSADKQKELIHGYYASVAYLDAQIGKVLNEIDRLGIRENTIIVLWGDHGYHLGDHGLWNKHSNLEQATHTLMMMRIPGKKAGIKPIGISEFTDVFPTLCELSGLPIPKYLDGISLVPAIDRPASPLREYAFSQYPRQGATIMGYSIRTSNYRYTEWMKDSYRTNIPYDQKYSIASEMFDYSKDPMETKSLIGDPQYAKQQQEMKKLFLTAMKREYQQSISYFKVANYQTPIPTNLNKVKSKANVID